MKPGLVYTLSKTLHTSPSLQHCNLEIISPPPSLSSVILKYKTLYPLYVPLSMSVFSFCRIYRVLLKFQYAEIIVIIYMPASPSIFHVSDLRVRCKGKVYSLWKILLRIQVTIIIHAKQIKLPNRPLWAITFIDSDWRIKHSQRFLVAFKRLPCLVRTENPRSFLTVEFICLR